MIELREYGLVKKPKVDLSLPSWRVVQVKKSQSRQKEAPKEDLSDEAFIRRHSLAEREEQELWDRWRSLRQEEGCAVGRREGDLGPDAPRLRSQRVASCGTPGRLSPTSMDRVREICVLPSTPTCVTVKTFSKAFETNIGQRKFQDSQGQSSVQDLGKRNSCEALCHKSPSEKGQEEQTQCRRKTSGSSRLRRSMPDLNVSSKENFSCHLLNRNKAATEMSQADRILKDSNVEDKKNVQQKTRYRLFLGSMCPSVTS